MAEKAIHRESAVQERSEMSFLYKPYLSTQKPCPGSGLSLPWLRPKATHLSGSPFPTLKHTTKSLKVSLAPISQDKPNRSRCSGWTVPRTSSLPATVSIFEEKLMLLRDKRDRWLGELIKCQSAPPARSRRDALAYPANEACSSALTLPAAKGEALR